MAVLLGLVLLISCEDKMEKISKIIQYSNGDHKCEAMLEAFVEELCTLRIKIEDGSEYISTAHDFFECFKKIRNENKDLKFYCKGAKKNVFPSRMTRQMSMGLSAYETSLGVQARKENLVNIFDYEDQDLVTDPGEQDEYQREWFASL